MTSAETAYLFRHALLREAAHGLMLPGVRAQLHGLALVVLEEFIGPERVDFFAAELADHARQAQGEAATEALGAKEVAYLKRAGDFARRQFRIDDSVRHFDRLAAHPHATDPLRQYAYMQAAYGSLSVGRHAAAEQRLTAGLQWAQAGDKPLAQAVMRASLAMVYEQSGHAMKAIGEYRSALPVFREFKETHKTAATLSNLSLALKETGQIAEAEPMQAEALKLLRELGSAGVGTALANLGNIHRETGRFALAEGEYNEALEFHNASGDHVGVARVLGNLALLLEDTGRIPEAEAALRKGLRLDQQTNNIRGQGVALNTLGRIVGEAGRHEEAEHCFGQALQLLRESGAEQYQAIVQANWGRLRAAQQRFAEAAQLLEAGIDALHRLNDPRQEGAALCDLSIVYEKTGRSEAARAAWQRGMALIEGIGDQLARASVIKTRTRMLGNTSTMVQDGKHA
jgi:tetratricopeptide (TPR) repeat protein